MPDESSRVAVYTAIIGGRDTLKEDQCFEGADFIAFTDFEAPGSRWQIRPATTAFSTPRRNSRWHKLQPQACLLGYDYSLWIDGSIRLLQPVHDLIDRYLASADLAVFRHSERDCVYDEAAYCKAAGLDDPNVIDAQTQRYREAGYPEHNGLIEAGVLLRRHTPAIQRFDDAWWNELRRRSVRDQISAPFAMHASGIVPTYFPDTVYSSSYFAFEGHAG